jgi:hypothetical protein
MAYRCATCGEVHDDLPDMGSDRPDYWWGIPEDQREKRIILTSDTCIIDGRDYFIRGVIEIPIRHESRVFGFGVWVSQSKDHFEEYLRNFNSAGIGPFFGWLCTRIKYYKQDTLLLKTRAHFRGAGVRPKIELEPTDHPLSLDQQNGIELSKAWEVVHFYEDRGSDNAQNGMLSR